VSREALAELLARAAQAWQAIQGSEGDSLLRAMEIGDYLLEAKELVGHGAWTPALQAIGIPPRTAQTYMRLAQHRDEIEASGATSIREALKVLAGEAPRAADGSSAKTKEKKEKKKTYEEGYADGLRDGEAKARRRGQPQMNGLPNRRDLLWLIKLSHPDRHQGDRRDVEVATRLTQWLNDLKGK
jgi:hypothetical protein